jgi:guanylate cyclase
MKHSIVSILDLGASPADNGNEKAKKRLFVLALAFGSLNAWLLGFLLLWHKEPLAGSLWLGWGIWQLVEILLLRRLRRLPGWLISVHLILMMFAPFALSYRLGSFLQLGCAFYAVAAPFLAVVLLPKQTVWLGILWAALTILGLKMEPDLNLSENLPGWLTWLWLGANTLLAGTLAFFVVTFNVVQRDRIQHKLDEEQKKTERLLLSIFPEKVAAQLKNSLLDERTVPVIAEYYPNASVLFADMVNFTPMATRMTAVELVSLLNSVFSHFDRLAQKRGLEKIKTVGDCYIVAAGVPQPRADHAHALAELALEIQSFVRTSRFSDIKVNFRIGINSGPLVAGVIGQKKISYDLWGDTVNIASRMSSQGIAGGIQITQYTYQLVKDDFICIPRGKIFIKGKGDMEIWLLTGKHNS